MLSKSTKIYIAGHKGMVGSSCWRILESHGYDNLIGLSSTSLDLKVQKDVDDFISESKPEIIINAAAKVGGILANDSLPYEFLMNNLLIQNNLIQSSLKYNIPKFIFLGSTCIYPKHSAQPIKEEYLLTKPLESTNQWYAIAKIAGVKLIEAIRKQYGLDYVSLMPTNLYGPGDNFNLTSSHVIPAMIRKFHEAKILKKEFVELWGTGTPFREFLHVDDLAKAVLFSVENELKRHIYNVGAGKDISIKSLAYLIKEIVGYENEIKFNENMPDGTPKKLVDSTKILELGWSPTIELKDGLKSTYEWYLNSDCVRE